MMHRCSGASRGTSVRQRSPWRSTPMEINDDAVAKLGQQ
jgi:hypothetical protein